MDLREQKGKSIPVQVDLMESAAVAKSTRPRLRFPIRAVARVAFGVGLLAFLLPFATVSCGGHDVYTFNGLSAATGGQYTAGQQVYSYSGDEYFVLALISAAVAFAFQFLRRYARMRAITSGLAGILSAVTLLIGQAHVNSQISLQGQGVVTIRWGVGYWVALFAIGAGVVMAAGALYGASVRSKPARSPAPTLPPKVLSQSLPAQTQERQDFPSREAAQGSPKEHVVTDSVPTSKRAKWRAWAEHEFGKDSSAVDVATETVLAELVAGATIEDAMDTARKAAGRLP